MSTTGTELTEDNLDTFVTNYIKVTAEDFTINSWSYVANGDGTNTLHANVTTFAPEPSMFGLLFGLGALGLVATRRRRKAA